MIIVYGYTVTDSEIRENVEYIVNDLLESDEIKFMDDNVREEFIEECVATVIDIYNHQYDYEPYVPGIESVVWDIARTYGYLEGE